MVFVVAMEPRHFGLTPYFYVHGRRVAFYFWVLLYASYRLLQFCDLHNIMKFNAMKHKKINIDILLCISFFNVFFFSM